MKTNMLITGLALLLALAACDLGGEQEQTDNNQQPGRQFPKVTVADVEAGIRAHIKTKTMGASGYYHFRSDSQEHHLRLVRVHTEYLSVLAPHRFFACVDLADTTGDVYDVDFFLKGEPGAMNVTQTTLHKLNGKPFYTWKQKADKTWHRVPVEGASNELLGVIEGTDTFEFRYEARVPELSGQAKMWLPIATSDRFQTVELTSLMAPGKRQMLKEKEYGNTILYLELGPQHSGQAIEITYNVVRQEKEPYIEAGTEPEKYLIPTKFLPVGGRFSSIARKAIEGNEENSKLVQARAIYDYVIDNVRYAKQGVYGTGDANYACDARSGNCTEFHSFFISLARSIDIPARFAIGAAIPSERDEGGVNGYHCWAEFYVEGKWWPIDISEGNKYTALATYYFGHHPANRIELSRGRNLKLRPGPRSGLVKFLAYPILETAEEEITVPAEFSFARHDNVMAVKKAACTEKLSALN